MIQNKNEIKVSASKYFIEKELEDYMDEHTVSLLKKIKKTDIVIGIPSFNNESTIGKVITSYLKGMKKYYPDLSCLIVNSDGGSIDKTREIVQSIANENIYKNLSDKNKINIATTIYKGIPGKGSAFKTIFEIARFLDAKVVVVSDSDTKSISEEWCYNLVEPVLNLGYGYTTPYYVRDKHDATITNAIVYPVTRSLYGLRLRQPIGGDFAFSNGALQVFLQKKHWDEIPYIYKFGIDIWMTTIALNEGFRVCQSVLGVKEHEHKDPGLHLANMFKEVIGTMFELAGYYSYKWKKIIKSNQGFIFGDFQFHQVEKIEVNVSNMLEIFFKGKENYLGLWQKILSNETFEEFMSFINTSEDNIGNIDYISQKVSQNISQNIIDEKSYGKNNLVIPVQLWAKIVYDYICAYNFSENNEKEKILESLTPLYFIRTFSFIKEAEYFDDEIADAVVEGNAGVFERLKGYLIKRWDEYKNKKLI